MERKPWMDQEAPVNYVAGLGRGATGFTTRSDIGPARMPSSADGSGEAGAGAGEGGASAATTTGEGGASATTATSIGIKGGRGRRGGDDDNEDYSEAVYDEFEGYGGSFNDPNAVYEQDDKEADEVYETIDKRMDSKRKHHREELLRKQIEKIRASRPKIQQQFADLKRDLGGVSTEEWESIPEIGDHTTRYKKKSKTQFGYMPVPDSLLEKAKNENERFNALDSRQQSYGGLETPLDSGLVTPIGGDLTQIGEARKTVLGINLNKIQDSVSGQTNVDPKDYLTDLKSIKINSDAEISDIKKARLLLKSVRTTNPKHGPGWIASARLEEVAGNLTKARKLITQATQICPDSEDVWLEAARLHTPENAKTILAKGINSVPKSVKIWTQAAALETEPKAKKRVLRKALETIPNSVKLWKAAIELEEDPGDAKILLGRAVECVPHSVEMWLALAHLESYENARKILNKAHKANPTDVTVWITAAKLEEAHKNLDAVKNIVKSAMKSLVSNQVSVNRDQWIKEAEAAEKAGAVATCQAIVNETIGVGVEDEDRKRVWIEDCESCTSRGSFETARAIYAHALTVFPGKKSLWLRVAQLEKEHGSPESLDGVLKKAVSYCPQAEILWLMAAKEKWLRGQVDEARDILSGAFSANPNSEQIWLAAVKLEHETNEGARARSLLERARERAGTERVWMKSALLERELGNDVAEKQLLEEAIKKYPQFPKFWMMLGQWEERSGGNDNNKINTNGATKNSTTTTTTTTNNNNGANLDRARETFQRGLKNCVHSIPLWLCAVNLEEKAGQPSKARSLLEKGRIKNPKNPDLWLASIRIEMRAGNAKIAQTMLAKALQECPNSGILWAEAVEMEKPPQKKARSVDALKRCDNDPNVIIAVAKIFWTDRKLDKTRSWLNRAVTLNPDLGDGWAYFYKFELHHGTEEQQQQVLKRCVEADPRHGERWVKVSKNIANTKLKTDQILKIVAASCSLEVGM